MRANAHPARTAPWMATTLDTERSTTIGSHEGAPASREFVTVEQSRGEGGRGRVELADGQRAVNIDHRSALRCARRPVDESRWPSPKDEVSSRRPPAATYSSKYELLFAHNAAGPPTYDDGVTDGLLSEAKPLL